MNQLQPSINPFVLMTDPQAVFAAIARSERLSRLESHLCRPLDSPLLGGGQDDETGETEDLFDELSW